MRDRDALLSSLTVIARRMRFCMAVRELAWAACAISSALVVYQILAAVIAASAVMNAITTLLALLLIGAVGFFAARSAR